MPLILQRDKVLEIFAEAASKKWVLPTFNAENLTTAEAILDATKEYGEKIGIEDLPIIIGITNNYKPRPQSTFYTHTRQWDIGMQLFLKEMEVLTSAESPFAKLKVMIHLDHIQWDDDKELLEWDMKQFSSIMFDASELPLEQNINKTAAFVKSNKDTIVIEGACDEINSAGSEQNDLVTPKMAEKYYNQTGVDIIVANLGTEHRASAAELQYRGDLARQVSERIGTNLCLHGTSSVSTDKVANLFDDGICKVNIWTTLERDSTPILFNDMIKNAAKVVGPQKVKELVSEQLLGEKANNLTPLSLDYFTTTYRQNLIFEEMKNIVTNYLNMWYILR
ncbi:MAG: class II fructose-bisphosphate aldolase [Melioribacteraceae bacterium]|nr:class II fructose-bisphosphate aldolase [Melioribacteraceae bacterium]